MCIFMLDGAVAGSMNGSYENPLGGEAAVPDAAGSSALRKRWSPSKGEYFQQIGK